MIDRTKVILVNSKDEPIGLEDKISAHLGKGKLHRAFSVFIFNSKKELLIQKRAQSKMLWPGFWANTCCSHPAHGESYIEAASRRLQEEMGIKAGLEIKFKFSYQADYQSIGAEKELCAVLSGKYQGDKIEPHLKEVAEWRWAEIDKLREDIAKHPEIYAPWFRMEMKRIKEILKKSDDRLV